MYDEFNFVSTQTDALLSQDKRLYPNEDFPLAVRVIRSAKTQN